MATPVWGLQALIASKTTPIDQRRFYDVIHEQHDYWSSGLETRTATVHALVSIAIVCYRFANSLGISLDDEIRGRLKQ